MREPLPERRWLRIETLFLAASDLGGGDREAFLREACGADDALLGEVQSLLRYGDADAPELLDAIHAGAASVMQEERFTGSVLGPYRLDRELGRGGMAVVCLGIRADGQFHQRVAIKLIKRGMDTTAVIERLRRERRILAGLEHPNIARLLDGGSTPEGLPYFVMEYVEGLPVDRFCDMRTLDLAARCELMARICDAVSYAHRKLVVHRDLKPANILIDAGGSPKLLDFGLARILDSDAEGVTEHSQPRPMTPDYASPEQLRGEQLTTATDIYSLGVILHELLTGVRPKHPAARPSVATGSRLRRLEGDLDNILMKAIHPDADRRYSSVDGLSGDLRRYLESRPVLARQDSLLYRTAKFVRRRKFALAAAAAILGSLIAATVISLSMARRAEARLAQIITLSDRSLSEVYALMERLPGAVPARKEMIATTLGMLEHLSKEAAANPNLRIVLARAYLRLGDLEGGPDTVSMVDFQSAIRTYRSGVALLENVAPQNMSREHAIVWLEMKRKMARLIGQNDAPAAAALLLETIDASAKLPSAQLAELDFARNRAGLLLALSRISHANLERAREYSRQYMNAVEALLKIHPADAGLRYDLSVAQVELGWVARTGGDLEAAARLFEQAMRARENLVRDFPSDSLYQRALMLSYEHYADVEGNPTDGNLGRPEIAREYYRKAKPLAESLASDPQNLDARASLGSFLLRSAAVETSDRVAIATLRRSNRIFEGLPNRTYDVAMSTAHRLIAAHLQARGDHAGAAREYQRSIDLADRVLADHPDRDAVHQGLEAESGLASILCAQRDRTAALDHAGRLKLRARDAARNGADPALAETWLAQASLETAKVHRAFDEWVPAQKAAEEALRQVDPDSPLARAARALIAECRAHAD